MTQKILFGLLISLLLVSCKQKPKDETSLEVGADFATLLDSYYEDGLKLNPINATMAGDGRYNHLFPNVLSNDYTCHPQP